MYRLGLAQARMIIAQHDGDTDEVLRLTSLINHLRAEELETE